MPSAVEEILRWSTPVTYFSRTATCATELRGQRIAEGDKVTLWFPSANRDESVFDDPFRFNVRRSPNAHVSFGAGGPHFCLGANLARMELRIVFEELLRGLDEIELAGPVERHGVGHGDLRELQANADSLPRGAGITVIRCSRGRSVGCSSPRARRR